MKLFATVTSNFRSHVATEENVLEAIRLFNVSTMDAARSGINQHLNLTPETANEIKVCQRQCGMQKSFHFEGSRSVSIEFVLFFSSLNSKQKPR